MTMKCFEDARVFNLFLESIDLVDLSLWRGNLHGSNQIENVSAVWID